MRFVKSSLLTKLIILTLMIYAVVMVVVLQPQISAAKEEYAQASRAVLAAEQTNMELQEEIDKLGSDEAAIEIARERLNMVEDGEVVFIDSNK